VHWTLNCCVVIVLRVYWEEQGVGRLWGSALRGWEVDGTGSGSCAMAGFGISGVEPSGSTNRELFSEMDLRKIGCEVGRWMELAQDRV